MSPGKCRTLTRPSKLQCSEESEIIAKEMSDLRRRTSGTARSELITGDQLFCLAQLQETEVKTNQIIELQ